MNQLAWMAGWQKTASECEAARLERRNGHHRQSVHGLAAMPLGAMPAGPSRTKPHGRIWRVEISIRRAVSSDAASLARLRSVMFEAMQVEVGDRDSVWLAGTREWFTHQLATSDVAAFVAQTSGGALVAAALGQVTRHAPSPANPSGVSGQLSNVVTDPEYRRLGLSRACVEQLLTWFRDVTDANDVGLFATDCGASLYESLGFGGRPNPAMSLNIRRG